ncbi:MAG: Gfo/Idh/MocA family oxidoreductase [Actinomycetes bacterium]
MVDDVRYGVIGTGMMGIEHLHNIAAIAGATVTAIADADSDSLIRGMQAIVSDPTSHSEAEVVGFTTHHELLESGLCDAVVIATPNHTHCDVVLDALTSVPHVLIEKPLCTTVADCYRVIDAAIGHEGIIWVGLEYRYMPAVARFIKHVHDGEIGSTRMLSLREHRFPFLNKVGDWNRFNRNSGGTLVEKCCHFFDLMTLVLGSAPTRVFASGAQDLNHLDELYDGNVPDIIDNALVIVDFENGARAMLDLCMFAEASEHQEELSAVGDLGKVEAFLPQSTVRLGLRSQGSHGVHTQVIRDRTIAYEGLHHGASFLEHIDFHAAVRGKPAPVVTLDRGLMSVAMGVAAQLSIDEGRVVSMGEILSS